MKLHSSTFRYCPTEYHWSYRRQATSPPSQWEAAGIQFRKGCVMPQYSVPAQAAARGIHNKQQKQMPKQTTFCDSCPTPTSDVFKLNISKSGVRCLGVKSSSTPVELT